MKLRTLAGLVVSAITLMSSSAMAANATCEEAKTMLGKAVEAVKSEGIDKASAKFMDPKGAFLDRDLYVFAFDKEGKIMAHGAKPALAGKPGVTLKDADGQPFVKNFLEVKESGVVKYRWSDPTDNKVKAKEGLFNGWVIPS